MTGRPDPVFAEPWHAQVFALTVHLNETDVFAWPDWAERFGATLKRHGLAKGLNGGSDYFAAWLETLQALLVEIGHAGTEEVAAMAKAWETAYLTTSHGAPVTLDENA